MININNNFFFDKKGFDFNNSTDFRKNLDIVKKKSDSLCEEFNQKKMKFYNLFLLIIKSKSEV